MHRRTQGRSQWVNRHGSRVLPDVGFPLEQALQPWLVTAVMKFQKHMPTSRNGANSRTFRSKRRWNTTHSTMVITIGCKSDHPCRAPSVDTGCGGPSAPATARKPALPNVRQVFRHGASGGEVEIEERGNRTEVSTGHRLGQCAGWVIYRAGANEHDKRDFRQDTQLLLKQMLFRRILRRSVRGRTFPCFFASNPSDPFSKPDCQSLRDLQGSELARTHFLNSRKPPPFGPANGSLERCRRDLGDCSRRRQGVAPFCRIGNSSDGAYAKCMLKTCCCR